MRRSRPTASHAPVTIVAGGPFARLDVEAVPGTIVALVASGRTTSAEQGDVVLEPVAGGGWRTLARSGISRVPVGLALFPSLTVQEHLDLGRVRRRRPDRTAQLLEWLPELDPLLTRRAGVLSGGERQLLAVARALAGTPRVLLVEQTSSGLSPTAGRRVAAALRAAADGWGTAVVAVDHRGEALVRVADRVHRPGGAGEQGGGP